MATATATGNQLPSKVVGVDDEKNRQECLPLHYTTLHYKVVRVCEVDGGRRTTYWRQEGGTNGKARVNYNGQSDVTRDARLGRRTQDAIYSQKGYDSTWLCSALLGSAGREGEREKERRRE